MKILIVASSSKEVFGIASKLKQIAVVNQYYIKYQYDKLKVDVLITGAGIFNCVYFLTKILGTFDYDIVLNVGLAGSYDNFLEMGFVVNVIEDQFGDIGVIEKGEFFTLFEMEILKPDAEPFKLGKLVNNTPFTFNEIERLINVKSVTLNTLQSSNEAIEVIREKYNPEIETLDGAAFFYCCLQEKIPFYQIRAISNYVEIKNVENWNVSLALTNLSSSVLNLLNELKKI